MSKIVVAANVMIENKDKISPVLRGGGDIEDEVFFLYDKKHKWSIFKTDDENYMLCFYPGTSTLSSYASMGVNTDWDSIDVVFYRTKEIGTKESLATFAELHSVVKSLLFGMDDILDDIIRSDNPF